MRSLFAPVELVNTQAIKLNQAQKITIHYIAEAVTLYETEDDTLVLKEYFNDPDPSVLADITVAEDSINIRHGNRSAMFSTLRGFVEVYLPRAFFGALNVKTVSGKLSAAGKLVLSDLAMSSTSGKIVLGDVTAGAAVLSTISGAIEVASLQAIANIRSTSGAIHIGSAAGAGEYKTVSGSIEVPYAAVTGDISLGSTSGRLRLMVPGDLAFKLDASSVSGSIDSPFEGALTGSKRHVSGTVGRGSQVSLHLRTVSGRIEVLPL